MENTKSYQHTSFLKNFRQKFLGSNERPSKNDLNKYKEKIQAIEELSYESKRFYMLFDHSIFFPAYMSKNIAEEGGYKQDYLIRQGLSFVFKSLHYKQLSALYNMNKWGAQARSTLGPEELKRANISFCGLKFKDKLGNWRAFFFNQKILTLNSKNEALLSFITAEEITYFHNSDVFWYRIASNDSAVKWSKAFFSYGVKKESDDLFTFRELEILKLSAEKKPNLEIAELLGISKNTVERHRKNMIAKLGFSNMTGVLRISQILNLI